MKQNELFNQLKSAYTSENLNKITRNLIRLYKERETSKLQLFFDMISDFSESKTFSNKQIFSFLISLYHPDKLEFYISELEKYNKLNNEEILYRIKHILLILNFEELTANIDLYEDIDYLPEFELDLLSDKLTFFTPPKKSKKQKTKRQKPEKYSFYDAIKIRMYGNLSVEFPFYYLEDLNEIELSGSNINDLAGVEFCKQTSTMDLSNNKIIDLSLLASLNQLEELNLAHNRISIIDDLAKLQNLKSLDLSFNQITEVAVLHQLSSLQYVNLEGNKIANVEILKLQRSGIETQLMQQ